MGDPEEVLARVEPAVQGVDLRAEAVEALEEGVKLAVVERLPFHGR